MAVLSSPSIFGSQARAQYAAVLRMRWRMQLNVLRTNRGRFELGARFISTGFFLCIALAIGTGFGSAAYQFASDGRLHQLAFLLCPVFFIWQVLPIVLASAQETIELGLLLRFPVSFGSYSLLYLFLGLFDLSSLMGGLSLLGILLGSIAARPALLFTMIPALAIFALFNLLLTRMIFAWIERWLARRRTREILGMVFLVFFLSLQALNPAWHRGSSGFNHAKLFHALHAADSVQRFFPPGLTAGFLEKASRRQPVAAGVSLLALVGYAAAAGGLLAFRLHAEFRGESLGEAPATPAIRSPLRDGERIEVISAAREFRWLDGPLGGILAKEIRYLSRSGVMLFGLITPLVFIFAAGRSARGGFSAFQYAFPVAVAYGFLPLTRQVCNSLGTEGAGIQLYFLSPTPFRTIMLAKNIVQTGLFFLELIMAGTIAIVRFGMPRPQLAIATACWLLFALPANLAAGNILSITMAYRMTLSRVAREQGSVGNGLLSLLVQLLIFGIGIVIYLPLAIFGHAVLAAPLFLLLAIGGVVLWRRVLTNVDSMANRRRESLIATLVRPV